jgi:hypothetical protein
LQTNSLKRLVAITEILLKCITDIHKNDSLCGWCKHRDKRETEGGRCSDCRYISQEIEDEANAAIDEVRKLIGTN